MREEMQTKCRWGKLMQKRWHGRQVCRLKGTIKTGRKEIECDYVPWVKPDQDSV